MQFNENIDNTVKQYVEDIVNAIKSDTPSTEVDINYFEEKNHDETEYAHTGFILTGMGMVAVFPDFNSKSATATIVSLGELNKLMLEGFTDNQIEEKGEFWYGLYPYNIVNVEQLAHYLSHKILDEPTETTINQ